MAPGLMTWILTDQDEEFNGQGQDQVPPPPPRQPHDTYTPPVGCFIAPHRCPHCEIVPANVFSLPPYSVTDLDPPPQYDNLFPPGYTPFPNTNTHPHPSFNTLPPTSSFPLDPPPSYDSFLPQQCLLSLLWPP